MYHSGSLKSLLELTTGDTSQTTENKRVKSFFFQVTDFVCDP